MTTMNNQNKGCLWILLLFPDLISQFLGLEVLDDSLLDDSEIFADEDFDPMGHELNADDFDMFGGDFL